MLTVGVIEGLAEATAAVCRVFSGAFSDYLGKRKFLMVSGYALAALSKPMFPLAGSVGWVFTARFIDRIGKGIRGAPRDALVADMVAPSMRGAAYGLRQALDSVGAFLGPLLAVILIVALQLEIRAAMWVAVVPAVIAVVVLTAYVREPERVAAGSASAKRLRFADAKRLPARYWMIVALAAVFTLARFSEAFLLLRAQSVGLTVGYIPAVLVVMNLVYASMAYPAGSLADRLRPKHLMLAGLLVLIIADLVLAAATTPAMVFAGAGLWGMHMALTQGLFSKLVADHAPVDLLGSAFGVFNLVSGMALLLASVIAGLLWDRLGAPWTFVSGAVFAGLAAVGLLLLGSSRTAKPL